MKKFHTSVLLKESIEFLNVKKGEIYIDATAGGGGHTEEILKHKGKVLAIDRDPEAIKYLNNKFQVGKDLVIIQGNFNRISEIAHTKDFSKVSGVLFDLGVSSHQLEKAERGFSFLKEGPLDMRMDPSINVMARDIINSFEKRRLNEIFQKFSDEKLSWPISESIISARKVKRIETTKGLAEIIHEVYRKKRKKNWGPRAKRGVINTDPATRVFQALRIVVNSELLNLQEALPQAKTLLKAQGRLVIISFHSLEDRIVKRFFKQSKKLKILTKTPIGPSASEIKNNPRSRSAKLRAVEKL